MAGRDHLLKLNDKTIAILGPFNNMVQSVLLQLCEQGADVAIIDKESPEARRFVDYVNDQREINPYYGRAGVISHDFSQIQTVGETLSKVVHSFGRLDCVVDTLPLSQNKMEASEAFKNESVRFLTSRPRSRILWLTPHRSLDGNAQTHETIGNWRKELTTSYAQKNLTANEVVVGITDEYLLKTYPKSPSIKKSFEDLKVQIPQAKILDGSEIAATLMFLCSPLSQGVNGVQIHLDHGLHFCNTQDTRPCPAEA